MAVLEKVDAVIVGAGAAGAVFAAVLTRAGKKVVLLEQGPDWQLSDLISSDIWGRRLKGGGAVGSDVHFLSRIFRQRNNPQIFTGNNG